MIKLDNLTKTYISKSKQKIEALKDINLKINDAGMVFILGKSGSGKSTLLNILGGLDSATSGNVLINSVSFTDFKQSDYDNYRNQYVGFVFQEFNLLYDFNVSDNVSIALQLSKDENITEKVKSALEQVGLSADYLTRKIDELSGGEKQRIAIARAIVKDSQMILADEPTGNLDSGTSESVFDILKNLSKKKLVIVVTHDRESAEKYGDRIIEIADGRILNDNGNVIEEKHQQKKFVQVKKKLSTKSIFKLGINNLLKRKAKSISVIILAILTVFATLVMQTTVMFSSEKSMAKFIKDYEIDYITVKQGKLRNGNEFKSDYILKNSTANYIKQNSDCIWNNLIKSKQDILNMGFDFVGDSYEINDESFYLTTLGLEYAYEQIDSKVLIDGKEEKLTKEKHSIESLIGKKVDVACFNSLNYTLAGVIDVSKINDLTVESIPKYFVNENFPEKYVTLSTFNQLSKYKKVNMHFGNKIYNDTFDFKDDIDQLDYDEGKIITDKGLQDLDEIVIEDDEIVLTFELYEKLFETSPQWSYISTDFKECIKIPPHIGEKFNLKFSDYDSNEIYIDLGSLKIAGIVFNRPKVIIPNSSNENRIALISGPRTNMNTNRSINTSSVLLVEVASIKNLDKFLVDYRNNFEGYVNSIGIDKYTYYSEGIYGFEQNIYYFKLIFSLMAIVLSIILILTVINLISFSITNRKKEIGILSALGTSKSDITKIFIIETLIISFITMVVNIVLIFFATQKFNSLFTMKNVLLNVSYLRVDIFTILTLLLSAFGILLLAALIPIRKIIKLKPIDAIKNL